jgi:NAD(P)-dependent dehydrogenase (short-subunit alcohol dehydrogenase family)
MKSVFYFALFLVLLIAGPATAGDSEPAEASRKAVLITGANSGLGRSMAELLASEGFFVYAGARKQADMDELNKIENIQAVRLDVTVQADIDQAVKTVTEAGRGLYGLINNAGVAVIAPLIEIDEEDFDFQMDVNVYGPYRVTRAFAPLLIESKGRISTVSSISGILSGNLFGPYSMSKHAMEAFGDSLAREMNRFGVQVSLIEPGTYNSAIGKNMLKRMQRRGQSIDDSLFKEDLQGMLTWMEQFDGSSGDPAEVAKAALHAMSSDQPKHRYMVVPNQQQADVTIRKAIEEMVQLNQQQAHSYSREELIAILDELLAANP